LDAHTSRDALVRVERATYRKRDFTGGAWMELPSAPSHSWITKLRHTDMVDMDAMCSIGPLH
jgi:hypothetical protein